MASLLELLSSTSLMFTTSSPACSLEGRESALPPSSICTGKRESNGEARLPQFGCHMQSSACTSVQEAMSPSPKISSQTKKRCLPLPASFLKGQCLPLLFCVHGRWGYAAKQILPRNIVLNKPEKFLVFGSSNCQQNGDGTAPDKSTPARAQGPSLD